MCRSFTHHVGAGRLELEDGKADRTCWDGFGKEVLGKIERV